MEAIIIPFKKAISEKRKCSFCSGKEPKVKIVITNGLDSTDLRCICSSCVTEASKRLEAEN